MALYKRGDLVWAKMKGFPPWPGIITAPPPELKKQPSKKSKLYYCIFFFGTKNYSWIETHQLERYKKGSGATGRRSAAMREAIAAIEAYIETGEGSSNFNITPEVDVFDKLVSESKAATANQNILKGDNESDNESTFSDSTSGGESAKETQGDKPDNSQKSDAVKDTDKNATTCSQLPNIETIDVDKEPSSESEEIAVVHESVNNPPEDPLKPDNIIDLGESSCSSDAARSPSASPMKPPVKPSSQSSGKKKQSSNNQQVVKARPFRQLAKNTGENDGPSAHSPLSDKNQETSPPLSDTVNSSLPTPGQTKKTATIKSASKKSASKKSTSKKSATLKSTTEKRKRGRHKKQPRASDEIESRSSTSVESPSRKRSNAGPANQDAKKKKKQRYSDADTTTPMYLHAQGYSRRGPAAHIFDRPPTITRPDTPPLDLLTVSQTLLEKHITPSPLRFGFLGLGIMGSGMVKNLLNSGHRVIVWNRSPEKSREFSNVGAEMAVTPQDVCSAADITFSCVSGPKAAKDMVFGNCGALREMNRSKAYVEMTNIDKETSLDIAEAITSRGARYLEAQIQGSKAESHEGTLVILTAGDRSLYDQCHSCFEAFGRSSFYLGEVGNASKMNLVIQMITGTAIAGLAEALALADRCGLQQTDILEVISMTSLNCPMIAEKGKCITSCSFPTSLALNHMQKDLKLGLKLGDELDQPLPLAAMANEVYKHAKRLGYGEHDASAVYIRSRY